MTSLVKLESNIVSIGLTIISPELPNRCDLTKNFFNKNLGENLAEISFYFLQNLTSVISIQPHSPGSNISSVFLKPRCLLKISFFFKKQIYFPSTVEFLHLKRHNVQTINKISNNLNQLRNNNLGKINPE